MQHLKLPVSLLVAALMLLAGCAAPQPVAEPVPVSEPEVLIPPAPDPETVLAQPVYDFPPNMNLSAPPGRVGVVTESLEAAAAKARELGYVRALLVARSDRLIAEEYFDGGDASSERDLRELTDFLAMLLVGTASNRREVSMDAPLTEVFPEWIAADVQGVTLRSLARHRSGLAYPDTVQPPASLMALPFSGSEETRDNPNDRVLVTHAIATATDRTPLIYAWDVILRRLSISPRGWNPDDQPWLSDAALTAQDIVRLLWIHANRGVWGDKHIASRDWLRESARGGDDGIDEITSEDWRPDYPDLYVQGDFWRIHSDYQGLEVREFVDPSGQRALVLPSVNAAILILTDDAATQEQRQAQVLAIDEMVASDLLPAFARIDEWNERQRLRKEQEKNSLDTSKPPWQQDGG